MVGVGMERRHGRIIGEIEVGGLRDVIVGALPSSNRDKSSFCVVSREPSRVWREGRKLNKTMGRGHSYQTTRLMPLVRMPGRV